MSASDPAWKKAVGGGLGCMTAALVTNPIDVLKIRLQIQGEGKSQAIEKKSIGRYKGFVSGGVTIFKEEGIRGLYRGITASLMREASYSSLRLGGYDLVKEILGHDANNPAATPWWKKAVSGLFSGAAGAAIANPTDLVKVRMQAYSSREGSRYRSTLVAFREIVRLQGWKGLYQGVGPTTQRAALLTCAQLSSYDHIKYFILGNTGLKEGIPLHGICSFLAGFISASVTSPVDLVKTRVMNQSDGGGLKYRSAWDCLQKTVASEGVMGLYKGFFPNWYRIAPHTVVTMLVYEQFRILTGMKPV